MHFTFLLIINSIIVFVKNHKTVTDVYLKNWTNTFCLIFQHFIFIIKKSDVLNDFNSHCKFI